MTFGLWPFAFGPHRNCCQTSKPIFASCPFVMISPHMKRINRTEKTKDSRLHVLVLICSKIKI